MPHTDRHKEREIPIEFDFYNTLESLPVDNRCTIIMVSCGSATIKINEYIQTVTAPTILCISQYDNFQCLERTHLSAKAFHFDPLNTCFIIVLRYHRNYYRTRILRLMISLINAVLSMAHTSIGNLQNVLEFHHRNSERILRDIACLREIKS